MGRGTKSGAGVIFEIGITTAFTGCAPVTWIFKPLDAHSGAMLSYFASVSMSVDSAVQVKVGDELAFRHSYGTGWTIHKVEKITPSGRIVCGTYTLNPDLRIRGDRGYHGPYYGEIVTPKIRAEVLRQKQLDFIAVTNWKELPDAVLDKVVAAIQSK